MYNNQFFGGQPGMANARAIVEKPSVFTDELTKEQVIEIGKMFERDYYLSEANYRGRYNEKLRVIHVYKNETLLDMIKRWWLR